jgi:hypothetical protein
MHTIRKCATFENAMSTAFYYYVIYIHYFCLYYPTLPTNGTEKERKKLQKHILHLQLYRIIIQIISLWISEITYWLLVPYRFLG